MRSTDEYAERLHRCYQANIVIKAIAEHGRRFFWDEQTQRVARISVDRRGALWFYDEYCQKPQYLHVPPYRRWKNFSGGGTLKRLVEALKSYIMTGEPISPGHFGPWSKTLCDGDLWGYGFEEMEKVRASVMQTAAVRKDSKCSA